MNEQEKTVRFEAYNRRTHTYGRIACGVTLVLLLGAPFLMGYILGAMPDMRAFGRGFLAIGIVWLVSCVAEYLVYTPMLGAGGPPLSPPQTSDTPSGSLPEDEAHCIPRSRNPLRISSEGHVSEGLVGQSPSCWR